MVLRVRGYANRVADDPVIRQWLWPQRIDFKYRRLDSGSFGHCAACQDLLSHCECGNQDEESRTNPYISCAFHGFTSAFVPISYSDSQTSVAVSTHRRNLADCWSTVM